MSLFLFARPLQWLVPVFFIGMAAGCALTPVNYQGTSSGRYDNGTTWSYTGGKFADQKDGHGVQTWSDGDRFEGEWVAYQGVQSGTMTYANGSIYTGKVSTNFSREGQGRLLRKDGCSYDGGWDKNNYHGTGTYRCPGGITRTGEYRAGKVNGRARTTWPDGQYFEGLYDADRKQDPAGHIRFASGDDFVGVFVADQRHGLGLFKRAADGHELRQYFQADTLMASIPLQPATSPDPSPCAAVPAGWHLVGGSCVAGKLGGDVVLATTDGMKRFSVPYTAGQPAGEAIQEVLSASGAVRLKGHARGPDNFVEGERFVAVTGSDKKGSWQRVFDGHFDGVAATSGRCLFRGEWESCDHAAGRRVDRLYVERARLEEQERNEREAQARREREEEEARERRERRREEAEASARRREEEAESRQAMHQAIIGGLNNLQQNLQAQRDADQRTAQLIAQANRAQADREAARQAEQRRAAAERDESRRQAQAAQSARAERATLQLAQVAAQQQAEQERRDRERRDQDAARKRDEERRQAAEASRRQAEEAAARRAKDKADKEAAERAQAEAQAKAKRDFLASLSSGTRLKARKCPDGEGKYYVVGLLPKVSPRPVSCVDVHYQAICPGQSRGVVGVATNFQGIATDCFMGDAATIAPTPSCPVDQVTVQTTDVRPCGE